jgi:hypothetical protein
MFKFVTNLSFTGIRYYLNVNSQIYIPSDKYLSIINENAEKEMIDAATLD